MDEDGDSRGQTCIVEIWACHMAAAQVFQLCNLGCAIGMGGMVWTGIDAPATHAALRILRIPPAQWPDIGPDVAYMGQVVANDRNTKATRNQRG